MLQCIQTLAGSGKAETSKPPLSMMETNEARLDSFASTMTIFSRSLAIKLYENYTVFADFIQKIPQGRWSERRTG